MGKVKVVRPRAHRPVGNHEIGNLYTHVGEDTGWRPPEELPVLDARFKKVGYDLETDGTDVFGRSQPIGASIALEDGRRYYLPFGHRGGGNLDRNFVTRWLQRELRDKDVVTAEGKFEIHMSRKLGVDLEAQGCRIREVQFKAALLDDQRRSFKLDDLGKDYLGKAKRPLERDRIWELPSYEVGPYAEEDAGLTLELDECLTPKIEAEGLTRVAQLEDDLIYCTCEMERNGVPIDVEKLQRWHGELTRRYGGIIRDLCDSTGMRINPDSGPDLKRLFDHLGIGYGFTAKGAASFTDDALREVDHPYVKDIRLARGLNSLKSKYVDPYSKKIIDGILRYKLHQMKADDEHGGQYGTISGRYSSSSINIQQVFDKKRQYKKFGFSDYAIRELFVPRPGRLWVKADAKQIEYRLFAHYANSPTMNERYRRNPETDFHEIVQEMIRPYRVIDRQDAKNVNFAKLYGSGAKKLSTMLNISIPEAQMLIDAYDNAIPEARVLMNQAMNLVKKRGFVRTILGRRARFKKMLVPAWYDPSKIIEEYDRIYSALNRAIQGSAADVMKLKLLEVYNNRHLLNFHMFFTVHDDVDGDVDNEQDAKKLEELLNEPIQELKLRVPILWDVAVGPNWAAAA